MPQILSRKFFSPAIFQRLLYLLLPALFAVLFSPVDAQAQGQPRIIQLSGIIASGDSLFGVHGASVGVPKAGRGTITNQYGFFSMPVLSGDSVEVKALGYEKYFIYIPADYTSENYSVIIELQEDITVLPEVRVFPYPTEKVFKEAFLALQLENEELSNAEKNLSEENLRRIFLNTGMDGAGNHRAFMNLQTNDMLRRQSGVVTNPLLNPFAWLQVIESIKRGDFKKKDK